MVFGNDTSNSFCVVFYDRIEIKVKHAAAKIFFCYFSDNSKRQNANDNNITGISIYLIWIYKSTCDTFIYFIVQFFNDFLLMYDYAMHIAWTK